MRCFECERPEGTVHADWCPEEGWVAGSWIERGTFDLWNTKFGFRTLSDSSSACASEDSSPGEDLPSSS